LINFIKEASVQLNSLDNDDIVKVAGVVRKLTNWFKQLSDPEYKSQVLSLRNDSAKVNTYLIELSKHINLLQSAIKDADVNSYETELDEVKFISKQLSGELEILSASVESVKVKEPLPIKNVVNETKNRAGYDVPVGAVNQSYKSFEHFKQITGDLIFISDPTKDKAIANVNDKITKLKLGNEISDQTLISNFIIVLKEAITNGVILENTIVQDAKKERPDGQMYVKVRTAPFSVPGLNLKIQGIALLNDLYAQKNPKMKLSLMRFTDIQIEKTSTASERKAILEKFALAGNEVDKKTTNLSAPELADVLRKAYNQVFGKEPTIQILGTGWAQSMAEQSGHYVNNNIGNITATPGWINSGGKYWTFETDEFDHSGKGIKTPMKFRAYDDPVQGAVDYWKQLATTWKGALAWFGTGDALHTALALGDKSYYTGNRLGYSGNMASLYDTFIDKVAPSLDLISAPTPPPAKFPEYKAFINSPKQSIPDKYVDKINRNTAYQIINDEGKQYAVLKQKVNQEPNEVAENTEQSTDSQVEDLMKYLYSAGPLEIIVKNAIMEKLLHKTQLLISIASVDEYSVKMEYASIVSDLLEKYIDAKTEITSNGELIEISCKAIGEEETVKNSVSAICDSVSDGFYSKKGCKIVKSILTLNDFSKLTSVSFEEVDRCFRKNELTELLNV
jgi:hypothetical protein